MKKDEKQHNLKCRQGEVKIVFGGWREMEVWKGRRGVNGREGTIGSME